MKLKRSERLVDMTQRLLDNPHTLISLTTFTALYQSAKSSISEDIAIIKKTFEKQSGLGTLRIDRDTVLALAGRFIIFPLLMVLVLLIGGADNTLLKETFIIQSTIPTLVIMPILAAEAKGDVDFATNVVTMTTIAYLAVLPLWSFFLFFI